MDQLSNATTPVTPTADNCLSASITSTSSSSSSSAPQYSDDVKRPVHTLELLPRQGSGSSTKTCEVDLGDEERDTFSPVTSSNNTPSEEAALQQEPSCSNSITAAAATAKDNKHDLHDEKLCLPPLKLKISHHSNLQLHNTPSKEEKQRQNEEIVILETSSISSETGSWDSIFPMAAHSDSNAQPNVPPSTAIIQDTDVDLTNYCVGEFLEKSSPLPLPGHFNKNKHKEEFPMTSSKNLSSSNLNTVAVFNAARNKDLDLEPLTRERTYSAGNQPITADTSSLFKGCSSSSLQRDLLLNKPENSLTASQNSNCFIDASSLCDEDEVTPCSKTSRLNDMQTQNASEEDEEQESPLNYSKPLQMEEDADDESPTKKLETFHKSFARCKLKSKDQQQSVEEDKSQQSLQHKQQQHNSRPKSSASDSSSSASSELNDAEKNTHSPISANDSVCNLSDEEKLWKRNHSTPQQQQQQQQQQLQLNGITADEILCKKPQQHSDLKNNSSAAITDDCTEASVSLVHDIDSSDSSDFIRIRKENPQKFNRNATTYSALPPVASKLLNNQGNSLQSTQTGCGGANSDVSYTTDYSSSSPAPSLIWSEHEHRPSSQQQQQQQQLYHQALPAHQQRLHQQYTSALHHSDDYDTHKSKTNYILQPDTPHNSIIHIDPTNNSSNTSSIHRDYTLSSSFSHHRDSGAYCSDATDSPVPMPRTPKKSKFDEGNPIISGGSLISDYQPKHCDSPSLKRRTDACPIVSGGFTSLDFEHTRPLADDDDDEEVELRVKPKPRKPIAGIASWVVDMSDMKPERRKSTSSSSSLEASQPKFRERSDSNSSHKSGCGFYVSLDDMDVVKKTKDKKPSALAEQQMSKSFNAPTSAKFYVNLSTSEYIPKEEQILQVNPLETSSKNDSQKNLFSMFIDIGNGKPKSRKEPFNLAQRLTSSLNSQNKKTAEQANAADAMKSSASSTETLMSKSKNPLDFEHAAGESKSLDYKINADPPLTVAALRRMSQQQKLNNNGNQQDAINKRHSWCPSNGNPNGTDYKRSISLTNAGDGGKDSGKGLMSIIDKLPIISKASSMSVDSSLSPYDDYTGSKSELSTSSGGEREEDNAAGNVTTNRVKRRRRDVQINETFDKSSLASITDGILSKDLSPCSTTDTDDLTFQQDEEQAAREAAALQLQNPTTAQLPLSQNLPSSSRMSNIIMETIVEAKETSSPKKTASTLASLDSLHATIEKQQKMLLETVNEHAETEKGTAAGGGTTNFVKLSDMDKPIKLELKSPDRMSTSVGNNNRHISRLYDQHRARPHSWTMSRSTGNSFLNITNSVENLRSLSRLFPNFSKEISNSLPNDMALDNMDYIQTDLSNDSSLASSISRSGMDESSISCRQPRRLGEDLLKMFLQEMATDMIVEVHGRRIKAHKCILRSRCQYFAAMLAGNQTTSVVSLQGYSYSAVHFALCHIYSGASHPPDGISLMELAALADLLGLEGLKEVTAHALKTNYCHNFHKPCSGCIDGILQVLPVALNHALDDLYRKCLRWTCRHYLKVWPTRQFAQLPHDILARCRQQIVAYLTSESVLDCVLDCDNLLTQLSSYRWGGVCENLIRDILDAAYGYIADHFASLIASDAFLSLGHDRSCHIPLLEGVLLRTASNLTPDQACRSYQRITRLNTVLQAKVIQMPAGLGELAKELQGLQEEDLDWDSEYIRLVSSILSAVEQCLIRQCSRAMRVTAWQRMDLDLRKKIQTLARLTEPLDLKRGKPVSKAFSFGGNTRNQELQQVKLAIQAHSKKAQAQDTQLYKATQTHDAVQTTERGVQANNDLREGTSRVLKSNSRAHVPQAAARGISQSTVSSERNSINVAIVHRRTKSEAPQSSTMQKANEVKKTQPETKTNIEVAKVKAQPLSLKDVRPRYLEPKKVHSATGPVRSSTTTSIPANLGKKTNYQHSSSESSRHSSPAARKPIAGKGVKSTNNMSLDSLASTSCRVTRNKLNKSSDTERFSDIGADSMNDSMKSSVITNKTASRESLLSSSNRIGRSKTVKSGDNKAIAQNQRTKTINGAGRGGSTTVKPQRPTSLGPRAPKYLQQKITSTGSSPSSVTTTKSATSRLSSVSSTQSARDIYKRSISHPGQQSDASSTTSQQQTKYTFLSAKSREILAKRAEKNKIEQQQQKQIPTEVAIAKYADEKSTIRYPKTGTGVMRSASHSSVMQANRNGIGAVPSNIPTRRPNTLQLKKTNGAGMLKNNNKLNSQQQNNKNNHMPSQNYQQNDLVYQTAHAVKQKIELLLKTSATNTNCNNSNGNHRVESKLERSSTFCKDAADVGDINDLQIIE